MDGKRRQQEFTEVLQRCLEIYTPVLTEGNLRKEVSAPTIRRGISMDSRYRRPKVPLGWDSCRHGIVLSSPVAMLVSDGEIEQRLVCNHKFTSLFGYTTDNLPDTDQWWRLAFPNLKYRERIKAAWQTRMERAGKTHFEVEPLQARIRCKDGSSRDIECHFASVEGSNLVSFVDLADRKRSEIERQNVIGEIGHLNRIASLGHLAASLAHELAQPLASILMHAEAAHHLASRQEPDLAEIRAALADIRDDDQRARTIVQNMRAIFQRQKIAPHILDLNRILNEVYRLVKNEAQLRGVHVQLTLSSDDVLVRGDEVVLQQIVMNLVNNGMDAMANLPIERRILKIATISDPDGGWGTLTVADNGPGISEELKPKLFKPFFTTKTEGLGIGLSICRALVESLEGHISLEHRSGPGSAFRVELPLATPQALSKTA